MDRYLLIDANLSRDFDYLFSLNDSKRVDIYNNSIHLYDTRDELLAIIEISILAIMFVLILFGNSFVLMALVVRKSKMNRMYYYLQHLCIGDLMCGFFNVFPQMIWDITYRFYGGNILCKAIKYLQILGPYLSSYILVITAIDRYQAICHPLRNCSWTQRRSKCMIIIAWTLSLLLCSPQLYIFSYQKIPNTVNVYDCWATFGHNWERIYVTWYAFTVFFVPFVIILVSHVCICRKIFNNFQRKRESIEENQNSIRFHSKTDGDGVSANSSPGSQSSAKRLTTYSVRQPKTKSKKFMEVRHCRNSLPNISLVSNGANTTPRTHSLRGVSRAKIKTVKITVVIMLFYALCSLPFICVQLWVHWFPQTQHHLNSSSLIAILMLLSSLNSSINPYICLFFNKNLIKSVKEFICRPNVRHKDLMRGVIGQEVNGFYNNLYETKLSSQTEDSMSLKHCLSYRRSLNNSHNSSTIIKSVLCRNSLSQI